MIARLVRSVDFERVLRTRSRASSAHFAVHHLAEPPSRPARPLPKPPISELSTGVAPTGGEAVDDCAVRAQRAGPAKVWLGAVVPKRHARRSVTRTLLKRQIRAVMAGRVSGLAEGLWVVRLRAPFDRQHFVSAASDALKRAARAELESLIAGAAQRRAAGA